MSKALLKPKEDGQVGQKVDLAEQKMMKRHFVQIEENRWSWMRVTRKQKQKRNRTNIYIFFNIGLISVLREFSGIKHLIS